MICQKKLLEISDILVTYPEIYDNALKDITQGKRTDRGAKGMSGEQVVRYAIPPVINKRKR